MSNKYTLIAKHNRMLAIMDGVDLNRHRDLITEILAAHLTFAEMDELLQEITRLMPPVEPHQQRSQHDSQRNEPVSTQDGTISHDGGL